MIESYPSTVEACMSIPVWFNKMLGTNFDAKISKMGINYLRDLFYYKNLESKVFHSTDNFVKVQEILQLKKKISGPLLRMFQENSTKATVILPVQTIKVRNRDYRVSHTNSKMFYGFFIDGKTRVPKGLLNWCLEFELTDLQVKTALSFANACKTSVFDTASQYKINTNIWATNEYLCRYRIKGSDICDLCQ